MAALFALGIYLQPIDGDLTLLGYFSERRFGWTAPQLEFPASRLEFPPSVREAGRYYDRYHDVLVLGDSITLRAF